MSKPDINRIMRRIKKCLALSESDNEHEAAMAMRHAQKLMQEYGIALEDAQSPDVTIIDQSEGKRARCSMLEHEISLYALVARFFGCELFLSARWPVFAGVAPAPQIAEYAAGTLVRQLRHSRKAKLDDLTELRRRPLSRVQVRDFNHAYGSAWVYAVSDKVKDFAQGPTQEQSDHYTRAFFGETDAPIHKPPSREFKENILTSYAIQEGSAAGRKAELSHGVGQGEKQVLLGQGAKV